MNAILRLAAMSAVVWMFCGATHAHDLPISNMTIVAAEDTMHVELVMNAAELRFFSEIDRDKNGFLDPVEVKMQSEQISQNIMNCFSFSINGKPTTAAVYGIVPDLGSHHLTIRAHYPCDAREAPIQIESFLVSITQRSHVIEVTLHRPDRHQAARLDARNPKVLFDCAREANLMTAPSNQPGPENTRQGYYFLFVGLAVFLGGLFLFRGKRFRKQFHVPSIPEDPVSTPSNVDAPF